MTSIPNFVGKYTNTISGVLRTLNIAQQDSTKLTLTGTWASTINGVAASFPVSGFFVPAPSGVGSSATYFVLSGSAQVSDPKSQPPIMRAAQTLVGYCDDPGSGGVVQQLFLAIAWAEDNPGYAKSTGAWVNQFLKR